MSYILDALRRADAERERGAVPGLQSQQHPLLDDDEARPRSRALIWVALAVALAAAVAWNFVGGEPPRATTVAEPRPTVPPPPAAAVPGPIAAVVPVTPVPAATATPAPAAAASKPGPVAVVAAPRIAIPPARRPPASSSPPAASPRAGDDSRVLTQAELPDDLRRELPRLAVGGASYSGDAASRMVILNGQIFHEGDKVAPGLVLEKIKLKAAVLSFKGRRFQIDY